MIVIFGHETDRCAYQVHQYLRQRGADVVFIEGSDLLTTMGVNWSLAGVNGDSFLTAKSHQIPLASISGVLARMWQQTKADSDQTPKNQQYIQYELHATMIGLLNALDCRVINRPFPGMACRPIFTGIERVRRIRQCGFKIPATLVTSSHEEASRFYDRCGRIAILGSLSGQFPWRLICGEEGRDLQAVLARHPIYLQEVPAGEWLQVFTVGERAFGASVHIDHIAGRNGKAALQAAELSPVLQERCGRLAQALRLDFAQLSILKTEQGEVYCFDVNGFPVYDPCEEPLQESIATALAELLEKGDRRSSDDLDFWRSSRSGDSVRLRAPVRQGS